MSHDTTSPSLAPYGGYRDGLHHTLLIFTGKSPRRILSDGGSKSWKLNPARARLTEYLVLTQNRHVRHHDLDPTEPHGQGFMVGKISGVAPVPRDGRFIIQISDYASIAMPDLWMHDRNPVRYTTLEDLNIDLASLDFKPVPGVVADETADDLQRLAVYEAAINEIEKIIARVRG